MSDQLPSRRTLLRRLAIGGAVVAGAGIGAGSASAELLGSDSDTVETSYAAFAARAPSRLGEHGLVWSGPTDTGRIALTFDDGPHPDLTPRILAILAAHSVTATFNVMGRNAAAHPTLLRTVVAAGHEIGNHSYNHLPMAQMDVLVTRSELRTAQKTIEDISQRRVQLLRPPHGQVSGAFVRTAAELGLTTVLWSVDRLVPGISTPDRVRAAMVAAIKPGDIVCLHDGLGHAGRHPHSSEAQLLLHRRDVEIAALPDLLTQLADRGIRVGTVSDLLKPPAVTVPGQARRSSRQR